MIQFLSVTKSYPAAEENIFAVEDVSFEIEEGEFVFLVGPSGSGKTTLIKMLIREIIPSEGKIFFNDEDITRFKRQQVYMHRRKIGVIFQDFKLIPELNAYENVAFAMEVAGRSEAEIKEHVPYLLDIVGLSNRMHFFPRQLSGGEKQRVAIARAISNNPDLLIADEPTGNLDPESAWDIVQILSKINNWGTTVLMSTHGFDIVNSLHKRVIKMQDGKMVRDVMKGTYEELDDFSLKVMTKASEKTSEVKDETETEIEEKPKENKKKTIKTTLKRKSKKVEVEEDEDADATEEDEALVEEIDEEETEINEEDNKKEKKEDKAEEDEIEEVESADTEDQDVEEQEEEVEEKKETKKKKVTKKEKEIEEEEDKDIEAKILEKIDSDEPIELDEDSKNTKKLLDKAKKTKISKLDLSRKELGALKEGRYETVADLIEAGVDEIKKVKSLTKTNIKNISKEIENFASNS
ncbi:cell division ATP-binding protein FtsE [Candidatus Dojkabacteria bacterium]|uniref:Cell division ATP-binding protein FtsE n=1 Tax=Candidatus Dojkabacteria bacterium TaxID=2099670 RepID=A0A955L5R1_9BACT|nr:cell division ATP-binding protein FtsE [Candidatus Dojkabacteria bacterium]